MIKVGDRVINERFGTGTVREILDLRTRILVEFDNQNPILHDGNNVTSNKYKDNHCWWCFESDLKKYEYKENKKMKPNFEKRYEVIINDPAVILFVKDSIYVPEKYVSKAHNEEFDPEKGLLMCLAKANGISHLDLKRMLKNATNQKEEKKQKTENKNELKVQTVKIKTEPKKFAIKSPCGKHRGKPFAFEIGNKVVIRECYIYKYEKLENVEKLLNKTFEITDCYLNQNGEMCYTVNFDGKEYLFAGSELEPVRED